MAGLTLDEFRELPSDEERGRRMKDLSERDRFLVRVSEPWPGETMACSYCKHYHRDAALLSRDGLPRGITGVTCDAFPGGIPRELLSEKVKHTRPYKGDHGIQFERAEEND